MKFSQIEDKDLRPYLEFLFRQYRLADAYWFLSVEDAFGAQAAEKLNEDIWTRIGGVAAREIKERFSLEKEGVARVVEALSYFPWAIITRFEMEETAEGARIRVPYCPPQVARVRSGRGEFSCKEMHRGEFVSFAREIDERVEVRCIMAPPDPHPDDLWCEWELRLADKEARK